MARFILHCLGFATIYSLAMLAALPFLVYFGEPKPWQKAIEFLLSFPFNNEKLGVFSFIGASVIVFLNGFSWAFPVLGLCRILCLFFNEIRSVI